MIAGDEAKTSVRAYSVSELVGIRVEDDGATWCLSLVQRSAVWDELKVRYLLDSLLCGYPIGSLLLCRVEREGSVLVEQDGLRHRREAGSDDLQLLDGQQRMNAMTQLFSRPPVGDARFLLRLDEVRDLEDVKRHRKALGRSLSYIQAWNGEDPIDERWRWVDLSGVYASLDTATTSSGPDGGMSSPEDAFRLMERVDPLCSAEQWLDAPEEERTHAFDRVRKLLRAWHSRSVPVLQLALEGPTDVLQVFNRVNRTGTAVSNDDMFFAAVRTQWVDAEENVERLRRVTPLLSRIGMLRLLARVARYQFSGADLLPLDIEKLGGEIGRELIKAMEELSRADGLLARSLDQVTRLTFESSGLGYALRSVPERLLDPVFAWAVVRPGDQILPKDLELAWQFLVGATCFQYRTIFREAFERLAFAHAIEAGRKGEAFPLDAILEACREKWPKLKRSRQRVAQVATDEQRRDLVNRNRGFLLGLVQGVPYDLPGDRPVDVEHLYPQAKRIRMKWLGADHSRKRVIHHPDAWSVNRAGNLYLLDASLNRTAKDDWPEEKLPIYRDSEWAVDLFLESDEEKCLLDACELIARKGHAGFPHNSARMAAAMELFTRYVQSREMRMFEEVSTRYPAMLRFAAEAEE